MIIAAGRRPRNDRGFTLVELMIVLAILGVASAVVVLTMPDPRGRLTDTAERFAARVLVVRDSAVIEGREMSLEMDTLGYAFKERRQGGWRPVANRSLQRGEWGEGVGVAIGREARKTISFDTTGLASEAVTVMLRRDGVQVGVSIGQDGTIHVGQ